MFAKAVCKSKVVNLGEKWATYAIISCIFHVVLLYPLPIINFVLQAQKNLKTLSQEFFNAFGTKSLISNETLNLAREVASYQTFMGLPFNNDDVIVIMTSLLYFLLQTLVGQLPHLPHPLLHP